MDHRGRFQAQGENLEESEAWAQNNPLSITDGRQKLEDLRIKIPRREQLIRQNAFEDCRRFIDRAHQNGGIHAFISKSFPGNFVERVDLEVRKGLAFI